MTKGYAASLSAATCTFAQQLFLNHAPTTTKQNEGAASDVFRHVGFSRTLVERAFRECLSSSVQKQIAEARIAEAKRLLETTSRPIKEIAALSGFSTLEYLSRAFAAATGVSPTTWRERSVTNA